MVVGVGKTLFHRLVATLGSPQKVFQAARRELQKINFYRQPEHHPPGQHVYLRRGSPENLVFSIPV